MWLRTGSPLKKMQNRFGRQENMNRGTYMGSHGVKDNRMNHRRSPEFWRSSKSLPEGNSGEQRGSTSQSSRGVQSGKNKHREEENGAAMCIDSGVIEGEGLECIGKHQDLKEDTTCGPGCNREVKKGWKQVNRVSSLVDKQNSLRIELGKRSEGGFVSDLRALKKKARVNKQSEGRNQCKAVEEESK
ncbi:hypothetical protein QYF36_013680 [Acer negundo]|nr:hypothetical protein QYF36_013680 [Acer negundo]